MTLASDNDISVPAGNRRLRRGLWLAFSVFAVDQLSKWWMIEIYRMEDKGRVAVTSFLDIVYVINPGVSYGLFEQSTARGQWFLAGFAALIALGITVWLARTSSRLVATSLALILGGALANALDRIFRGGVADFFSLHANGFYWYIFNIADVAITLGVIGLIVATLRPTAK